jgi:hypothetical protein
MPVNTQIGCRARQNLNSGVCGEQHRSTTYEVSINLEEPIGYKFSQPFEPAEM